MWVDTSNGDVGILTASFEMAVSAHAQYKFGQKQVERLAKRTAAFRLQLDVCMGMGMGFPIPRGFPWDSHGNGNSHSQGIPMGFPWEMGVVWATNGNGNGNGNSFNGNGNSSVGMGMGESEWEWFDGSVNWMGTRKSFPHTYSYNAVQLSAFLV